MLRSIQQVQEFSGRRNPDRENLALSAVCLQRLSEWQFLGRIGTKG